MFSSVREAHTSGKKPSYDKGQESGDKMTSATDLVSYLTSEGIAATVVQNVALGELTFTIEYDSS